MDLRKAFIYSFEDEDWVSKLGIGLAISLVPILNFAWIGYIIDIMRNVIKGEPKVLPGWDNLGEKFMDGLMLYLASLVYALPALLLIGIPMVIMIVPALLSSSGNMQNVANALFAAGGFVYLCLSCILLLYGLALSVVYPAIFVEYARQGTFVSCFQFKAIFTLIQNNVGPFFTAWGIYLATAIGSGIAIGIVGGILGLIPCLGGIVAFIIGLALGVYTSLVYAHLFGQFSIIEAGSTPPATA